jgi:hypothetical protein
MTVESPYQRRTGDDPDALDPAAAGYPASYPADEAESDEESGAEHGAEYTADPSVGRENEYETDNESEHEENDAPAGGAWPEHLNTGTTAEPTEQTDEDDDEAEDDESEPAASAVPEGSAFGESVPEESASEEVASEEAAPEAAAWDSGSDESDEAVEEEAAVPDEAVLEEESLEVTEPETEPAVGEAVGSGSLIAAEPETAFSPSPSAAAAVTDTIIPAEQAAVFATRLRDIQVAFIDEPHKAAEDADRLLGEVAREFAAGVEAQRGTMRLDSDDADAPQTEQLRIALQHYRKLVDVLLSC